MTIEYKAEQLCRRIRAREARHYVWKCCARYLDTLKPIDFGEALAACQMLWLLDEGQDEPLHISSMWALIACNNRIDALTAR